VVAPDAPILTADDLGVVRGDGIFETLHVRDGRPFLLDEHLARMSRSATALQLDLPEPARLVALAGEVVARWPSQLEGSLRLTCTRGREDGGPPTVFATVSAVPPAIRRARREGITVLTASLGIPAELRPHAPWLLGGAKTVSYAVNMASQRWAQGRGADDVLWVSADGYCLEAPTSTLVWLSRGRLCTVPAADTGILAGTTAAWLLRHAGQLGYTAGEEMIAPGALSAVEGAWLVSSVRGVAEIRTLDGVPVGSDPPTTRLRDLLGYPATDL
jgi:4-amino-4-deoxychorismate lyase